MNKDELIIDLVEKNKELREKLKSYSKKWEDLDNIIKKEMYNKFNTKEERTVFYFINHQMLEIKTRLKD